MKTIIKKYETRTIRINASFLIRNISDPVQSLNQRQYSRGHSRESSLPTFLKTVDCGNVPVTATSFLYSSSLKITFLMFPNVQAFLKYSVW